MKGYGVFVAAGVATLGLAALPGIAIAADSVQFLPMPAAVEGYVDIHGGFGTESFGGGGGDNFQTFGGAGRAAFWLTPDVSVQVDAWTNHFSEDDGFTDSAIGGHLSWRMPDGNLVGALVSLGDEDGLSNNVGVEAVHNYSNWSLYGQVGVTSGLQGEAGFFDDHDVYAMAVFRYYSNPNLVLSGNLGFDHFSNNDGNSDSDTTFGLRVEWKPPVHPFSLYAQYEGFSGSEDFSENEFLVGGRVLFGQGTTLQQIDRDVGLEDLSDLGDIPH